MDAPELEAVRAAGHLVDSTDMLHRYVRNETPSAAVLRDHPFGAPPAFGGETPFFTQAEVSPNTNWDLDDTEGIPTGLPDLINLSPVPTPPPAERGVEPSVLPAPIHTERRGEPSAVVALFLGMAIASAVWVAVFGAWLWVTST